MQLKASYKDIKSMCLASVILGDMSSLEFPLREGS
jgi:hypothetical protein